jgi:hypothetical protein
MNKQQTTRIAIAITISSIIAIGFVMAYFADTIMLWMGLHGWDYNNLLITFI